MITVRKEIQELLNEVSKVRRELHQIPEIGLDTIKTKQYIINKLKETPCFEIVEGYAKNGVVAFLRVNDETESIGFRTDIDALPILEETGVSFTSNHKGCSHACGHDGHMAIMLGFIKFLSVYKERLTKNITIVFQPGEEGPGGAQLMIEEGLFQQFPMKYIIGTHLMADVEGGKVACCKGPIMARNGEFSVDVFGVSAHGAQAYEGRDAIVAASALIQQLQSIVSRSIDPLKSTVITVGKLNGGQARNQICDHMNMLGTIRSFHDDSYELMKKRMFEVAKGIELSYDVNVKLSIDDYYYAVNNDEMLDKALQEVLVDDYVKQTPKMTAEDFSFYQREVPGLFYFTGVGDDEHTVNIHHCKFNFNEKHLLNAIETNVRLLTHFGVYHD